MKKYLPIVFLALAISFGATSAHAQQFYDAFGNTYSTQKEASVADNGQFVALAPIPNLTDGTVANSGNLANFFNNLYKYLIGLAAMLAVIEIIWGGLEISTKDSVSKQSDGKERITQAIFGLILVLSPVLVFSIINPSILNLSLNLPALETKSTLVTIGFGSDAESPVADATTVAATTAGCTVNGTLLKTATCPTQKAAEDFATACSTGSGNVPFLTTDHKATCSTQTGAVTGPYSFADTSSGYFSAIVGYSNYEPLTSAPGRPNNGADVLRFASTCTADGGTTCMSTVKLPCASKALSLVSGGSSVSCWEISLSCTNGSTGAGGCSSNPNFTVVTSK